MHFRSFKREKTNAQRLFIVIPIVIMLFVPLYANQGKIVYAASNPSLSDNTSNIPLAIPTTNKVNSLLPMEEQQAVNKLTDNMMSNLQIRAQGSEDQAHALATCDKLAVSAVAASGNDGNVPSNVLDNSLGTRWSNLGQGSWIQLDLGSKKSICSVDIAWYRGDIRQNNFVISVSDDGTTFTSKLTDTSSLGTAAEKYILPEGTEGKYVRITVNGNTENDWASINEISVFGGAASGGGGGGSNVIGTLFHKWQTSAGDSTWSPYTPLSGNIAPDTDMAIAMNTDGRLQVFVIGTNNQLFYKTQTAAGSSTWTGWTSLGGGIKADTSPAVARNTDGRLQVFVVGTNNALFYKTQSSPNSNSWPSSWTSLGGGLRANTDPIAIANNDGRLQVFVVSTNNQLFYKTQTAAGSSTWTGWTSLGGGIKADTSPAVARNTDGRLQVFVVGTNNQLQYQAQTAAGSNTWSSAWTSLGGGLRANTDPIAIANNDGRLQVFVVSTNNQLFYKTQTAAGSSTWTGWTSLGGGIKADTSPAVARNTDGRLQVFVVGTNNALFYKTQSSPNSNTWSSAWTSLGGGLRDNSDPAVVPNADGRLDAFVVGPTSTGPPNSPGGDSTTRDGVTVPFKIKGQWDYEYEKDERDGGARHNMNAAGTSLVMVGYFRSSGGSDDVAMKLLGGAHTDSAPYDGCVYDPAIAVDSGQPRLRAECPHPDYTDNLDLDFEQQGVSIHNRWVGFMAVALQEQAGVRIQVYQDQGNNDNQPANQWVKVLEFFDDGTKVSGIEGADRFPLRELPATAQNTFRIDETPGLQEKWLAIAEIDLSVLSSVQFIQTPTADPKGVTTGTNAAVDITLSGTDLNNDPITFSIVDQPMHGQLSTISAQNIVTYTPTTGYIGPDSFTYVARDSKGATSINKATVSITVSSTDGGTNDKFGIKKIYPTKPGGEEWYMNMDDPQNDPRTSEPSMSRNSDGSWRVTSGQVRYGVFTSSGYQPDNVVEDHSVLASRGYMQSPNDWKNVEMTGQVKYNSGGDDEWTWYARGGRHTGSGSPEGCEGVAYKGSLAYTGGDVRWAKEQWHVSYVFQPWRSSPADGDGQFVGFKVAIYNMQVNGETVVKMESWVDPNNDNQWQKVYDFIDQGGWGSEGGECNGEPDQIVTWGGPIASFRWDNGNSIDIKNLSVREITPPT